MRRVTAPIDTARTPPQRVLTVGAGASPLVGALLASGHQVLAVDIAQAALDTLAAQLDGQLDGQLDRRLSLLAADVRSLRIDEPVDVWHDRAVFHFLVDPVDQASYVRAAADAVTIGGHLVIATFAPGGPTTCSGLPVQRHDASSLRAAFAPHFELLETFDADHVTPWQSSQRFTHAVLRRT